MSMLMRSVLSAGARSGIEWLARRSEKSGDQNDVPKEVSRQNGQRIRQAGRLLRRFTRF